MSDQLLKIILCTGGEWEGGIEGGKEGGREGGREGGGREVERGRGRTEGGYKG